MFQNFVTVQQFLEGLLFIGILVMILGCILFKRHQNTVMQFSATIEVVWTGDRIYCTLLQLVTTVHR
jgi:hypothetical protein